MFFEKNAFADSLSLSDKIQASIKKNCKLSKLAKSNIFHGLVLLFVFVCLAARCS